MQNKLKALLIKVGIGSTLALGLGLMIAGVAHADGKGGRGGHGRRMLPPEADVNKDGKIDDAERQAFRAKVIAGFDKNGDGQLDDTERKAMHEAKLAERFSTLDTNKDKVLSWDEFKAGKGPGMRHGTFNGRPGAATPSGKPMK